ncbi:hypothetical protein SVIOM342S_07650 [Streptomyces violaceorubidus]
MRPISSSLYGSSASSSRAASSLTTRRENRCPRFWISCIFFSMALRSSGWKGFSTSKSEQKLSLTGGPMPSLASGNSSCTACAMTCAVEWRRMSRPSSEEISTPSTVSPSRTS